MAVFRFNFKVKASVEEVAAFHAGTQTLKTLTPALVKIHEMEPLGEGSVSRFTVWFGPLPIKWAARHSNISDNGFTDSHIDGPMASWVHTHRFVEVPGGTQVRELVTYEHKDLPGGIITRIIFSKPAMYGLFAYRMFQTKRLVKPQSQIAQSQESQSQIESGD